MAASPGAEGGHTGLSYRLLTTLRKQREREREEGGVERNKPVITHYPTICGWIL